MPDKNRHPSAAKWIEYLLSDRHKDGEFATARMLCEALDVHEVTLSRNRHGAATPSASTVRAIMVEANVTYKQFCKGPPNAKKRRKK